MPLDVPGEQVRAAIDGAARDILAAAGVAAPPVDAFELALRMGLTVARGAGAGVRAEFVRVGGFDRGARPTILLADDPRFERRQWAVAHEVAEHEAHRVFESLGVAPIDAAGGTREQVANRLAGCLLLPRDEFLTDGRACDWDLAALKARYVTASHELIVRRMLEMPPGIIITLFDHDRLEWRRSNIPGRTPPLTPPERDAQHAAHVCGEPSRCDRSELPDGIEDVRAWPVHEPLWKREFVRTQIAEELW